jgi:hypothetical protein
MYYCGDAVLLPSLGDLPVFVYALTISIMLLFAFKGYLNWHRPSNGHILIELLYLLPQIAFGL